MSLDTKITQVQELLAGIAAGFPAAALANSLVELLFSMIVLGDDRLVEKTVVSQAILASIP